VHARHDPVVSYRADVAYAATVAGAGRSWLLAPVLTDESDHSRLRDASYLGALKALEGWLDTGVRPDAAAIQAGCTSLAADAADCRFLPLPLP
jgi:hypothetical protein